MSRDLESRGNNHLLQVDTKLKSTSVTHFSNNSFLMGDIKPDRINIRYAHVTNNKTMALSINEKGEVSGIYEDENGIKIQLERNRANKSNLLIQANQYELSIKNGRVESASFVNKGDTHKLKVEVNPDGVRLDFTRQYEGKSYRVSFNKNVVEGSFQMQW